MTADARTRFVAADILRAWERIVTDDAANAAAVLADFKKRLERFGREQPLATIEHPTDAVERLLPLARRFVESRDWLGLLVLSGSRTHRALRRAIDYAL